MKKLAYFAKKNMKKGVVLNNVTSDVLYYEQGVIFQKENHNVGTMAMMLKKKYKHTYVIVKIS